MKKGQERSEKRAEEGQQLHPSSEGRRLRSLLKPSASFTDGTNVLKHETKTAKFHWQRLTGLVTAQKG